MGGRCNLLKLLLLGEEEEEEEGALKKNKAGKFSEGVIG